MLFDTNLHVTLDEKWNEKVPKNKFLEIIKIKKKNNLKGFCAVGIHNIGNYDHKNFINKLKKYKFIYPVAPINLNKKISDEFDTIKKLGYNCVKIHNRSFNKNFNKIDLDKIFYLCEKNSLRLMICTYFNDVPGNIPNTDAKYILAKYLNKYKDLKIMLLHGGCERLMEFAEMIRFSKNIFLDLSLTLTKYENSSIDSDIKFLFKNFDRKITLGSDYPDVQYNIFMRRVNFFSKNLSKEKKENIFYKNALRFIK